MDFEKKKQLYAKLFPSYKGIKIFFEEELQKNNILFENQLTTLYEEDDKKKKIKQYDFEKELAEIKFLIAEGARKGRIKNRIVRSFSDDTVILLNNVKFSEKEKREMSLELNYIYDKICSLLFYKIVFKNADGKGLRSVMQDYKNLVNNIPFEAEERMKFLNFSLKKNLTDEQFKELLKLSEKAVELLSATKKEEVNIHSIIPDNLGRMNKMLKKDYRKILSKHGCSIYDTEVFNNFKNSIRNSVKEAKKKRKLLHQTEKAQEKENNKNEMLDLLSSGMNISSIFDKKITVNSVVREGV